MAYVRVDPTGTLTVVSGRLADSGLRMMPMPQIAETIVVHPKTREG